MKLLVFVGPKQSGKDASSAILKEAKIVRGNVSFALPLKRICAKAFNLGDNLFHDNTLKERPFAEPITVTIKHLRSIKDQLVDYVSPHDHFYNINGIPASLFLGTQFKTPREILQIIGTELIRNTVHQDYHCLAAFSEHNQKLSQISPNALYAVTDCRFVSEYEYLKKNHECLFFYVERPEAEQVLATATHASELEVLEVRKHLLAEGGTLIQNIGTLDELKEKLMKIPSTTVSPKPPQGSRLRFKNGSEAVRV